MWLLVFCVSSSRYRGFRAGPRGGVYGGGALQAKELSREGQAVSGEEYERGGGGGSLEGGPGEPPSPRNIFKIFVSENAFQAILKPSFPYTITSILSKVRHSNPRGVVGGGGGYSDIFIHT